MITIFCFFLLSLLAVRSLILAFSEAKPWYYRILDILMLICFAIFAEAIFLFSRYRFPEGLTAKIALFVIAAIPVMLSIDFRLRRRFSPNAILFILKAIFTLGLLAVSLLAVMSAGFLYFLEDQPVLKVVMTGQEQTQLVEWQPPNDTRHKENLTAYEVLFQTPQGAPVAQLFVYGDQVAVKAKIIRFQPTLNLIGLHNLCRIDYVHNGYTTAKRFNYYPHQAQEIRTVNSALSRFQDSFWQFWERIYYQQEQNAWIKSATLESTYFPLVDPKGKPFHGAFYLTINPGGLSSVSLP